MENRIKIGDEWYVKESTIKTADKKPLIDLKDAHFGKVVIWEDDKYCFEASFSMDEVLDTIEVRDKLKNTDEYWDNPIWFERMLSDEEDAYEELDEDIVPYAVEFIKLMYKKDLFE